MSTAAWVNGQPAYSLGLNDRGLAYGDGLFETMAVHQGQVLRLELHLERLATGCQRLAIPLELALLRDEIQRFCRQYAVERSVCKLIVTRGAGARGYAAAADLLPQRILQLSDWPQWPEQNVQQGIELFACQTSLARSPGLAGIKHLNRLEQVLARAEWQDSRYAEGLMLDSEGYVTDCVFSNVFFVRDGQMLTPQLTDCGVAGVMRAYILQLAAQLGLQCRQTRITVAELADMDEVFTCNSLYGIWPVVAYQQHRWPVGDVTRTLAQYVSH